MTAQQPLPFLGQELLSGCLHLGGRGEQRQLLKRYEALNLSTALHGVLHAK